MVGRGAGGSPAPLLPSPLLLPPMAQSHRMVWEHCSRLWSLPEHTTGILDLFWEEEVSGSFTPCRERVGPHKCQNGSTQPGVMAACREWQAGTGDCWRSHPAGAGGKAAMEHPGLLCQGQSLGESGAGC